MELGSFGSFHAGFQCMCALRPITSGLIDYHAAQQQVAQPLHCMNTAAEGIQTQYDTAETCEAPQLATAHELQQDAVSGMPFINVPCD